MKKILFIINLLFCFNLCSDVPECALIKTNNGTKLVEQFALNEKVTSYRDEQFKEVSIESIAKYKSKDFVVIQTSSGRLICGIDAKVFSVSKKKFIKSTDLDKTDVLLSFDLKEYPIQEVIIFKSDEKEKTFYVLSLKEPHTFFQCDSNETPFLMHNNPAVFILEYIIERSPEILGFVIDKAPEIIEIGVSSVLALFGAKIAHDRGKSSYALDEQRKAEIRQKHIESLQDKVRWGKATHEDIETLHLLEDYPEISYEELYRRIEENRKYRETFAKDKHENLIRYYLLTQQIKANNSTDNINLNNDVSTEKEKQPPVINDENNKSDDNKSDDKESDVEESDEDKNTKIDKNDIDNGNTKNDSIIVNQGRGKAPKVGAPGSIYEKIDNKNSKLVVSRTTYNSYGKIESREDYYIGERPHAHFDKQTNTYLKNHKHVYEYNKNGFIINKYVFPI